MKIFRITAAQKYLFLPTARECILLLWESFRLNAPCLLYTSPGDQPTDGQPDDRPRQFGVQSGNVGTAEQIQRHIKTERPKKDVYKRQPRPCCPTRPSPAWTATYWRRKRSSQKRRTIPNGLSGSEKISGCPRKSTSTTVSYTHLRRRPRAFRKRRGATGSPPSAGWWSDAGSPRRSPLPQTPRG